MPDNAFNLAADAALEEIASLGDRLRERLDKSLQQGQPRQHLTVGN